MLAKDRLSRTGRVFVGPALGVALTILFWTAFVSPVSAAWPRFLTVLHQELGTLAAITELHEIQAVMSLREQESRLLYELNRKEIRPVDQSGNEVAYATHLSDRPYLSLAMFWGGYGNTFLENGSDPLTIDPDHSGPLGRLYVATDDEPLVFVLTEERVEDSSSAVPATETNASPRAEVWAEVTAWAAPREALDMLQQHGVPTTVAELRALESQASGGSLLETAAWAGPALIAVLLIAAVLWRQRRLLSPNFR